MGRARSLALGLAAMMLFVFPVRADECQRAGEEDAIAEGRLIERGDALIVKLPAPMCLTGSEASDNVAASTEVQVFSFDEVIDGALRAMVGKDVHVRGSLMGAVTKHHKAPIVMQVTEADKI